jgi:hypothetical protein
MKDRILKLASKDPSFRNLLILKLGFNTTQDMINHWSRMVDKYTREVKNLYNQISRKDLSKLKSREAKLIAEKINPLAMDLFEKTKKLPLSNPSVNKIVVIKQRPMYRYIQRIENLLEKDSPPEAWDTYLRFRKF